MDYNQLLGALQLAVKHFIFRAGLRVLCIIWLIPANLALIMQEIPVRIYSNV